MDEIINKILLNIRNDNLKYEIENIFLKDNDFEEIFDKVSLKIGFDKDTIHFYLYFADNYSKKLNKYYSGFNKYIGFILENYSKLATQNIYVLKYFQYSNGFYSKNILDQISKIEISKIDKNLIVILLDKYIYDFSNIIFLKDYIKFFKNNLLYLIQNDFLFVKNIRLSLFKLCNYFGFSLSEAIDILYYLKEKGISTYFFSDEDIGYINNLDENIFVSEINKLNKKRIVQFFYDNLRKINLSKIDQFSDLNNEIRFFISYLSGVKYFNDSEDGNFFDYYLWLITSESFIIDEYNKINNFELMLDFLSNNKVCIFSNEKFYKHFFKTYFGELRFTQRLIKIMNSNIESFVNNYYNIIEEINIINVNNNIVPKVLDFILDLSIYVIRYKGLVDFIHIIKRLKYQNLSVQFFDMRLLFNELYNSREIKNLTYINTEVLLLFGCINLKSYSMEEYLYFIGSSGKGKYIIGKNISLIERCLNDRYSFARIKQMIFYSRIFPINLIHYFRMKFE